jgi:DNA invertase Pin-like site-specific DNA recombinase
MMSAKEDNMGRRRRRSGTPDGPRCAAYRRVSTPDQSDALQIDGLRDFAARSGLTITMDLCDLGYSGTKIGRPALRALMTAARNRDIDCVLVWRFDRFARSTRHLIDALDEFNHLGVRFISVQDQIDTDSPMGRAMFTLIASMAELESSLISERVTAGMRAAAARGVALGRKPTPPPVVREIERLAAGTALSVRAIQQRLRVSVGRGVVGDITKRVRQPAAAMPA